MVQVNSTALRRDGVHNVDKSSPLLDPYLWVLIALAALLIAPLTAPGYFSLAHDARHSVYFLQMFDDALRDGALYPRWAADMTFGYGYPLWVLLAPLPFYLGEIFHLLGLDIVSAVKAVDAVALLGSGLAMYIFAKRVTGKEAGLVAAVAYLFIPYHIVDLDVRAAQPELLAFIFPPLIMWALYELVTTRRLLYVPLAALSYAGLILTHAQSTAIYSPLIGSYLIVLCAFTPIPGGAGGAGARIKALLLPLLALAWGVLLSAAYIFPLAFEQRFLTSEPLTGGFFSFRQHFISLSELLSPFWGYGYAGINGADQFSLQLGIVPLLLALLALFTLRRNANRTLTALLIFFALATAAAVVLMLPLSEPLWSLASPVVAFAQFPWRLLMLTTLGLAFLCGAAVLAVADSGRYLAALVLSLLLALALFLNARPQYSQAVFNSATLIDFQVKDHELLGDTIWMTGARPKDSPLVDQYRAGKITQKATIVDGSGTVELLAHHSQWDEVRVTGGGSSRLLFYTHYFPGWSATIDGAPAQDVSAYGDQGLLSVMVPAGTHIVRAGFGDTWPRQAGVIVSVIALIAAGVWLWRAISASTGGSTGIRWPSLNSSRKT